MHAFPLCITLATHMSIAGHNTAPTPSSTPDAHCPQVCIAHEPSHSA